MWTNSGPAHQLCDDHSFSEYMLGDIPWLTSAVPSPARGDLTGDHLTLVISVCAAVCALSATVINVPQTQLVTPKVIFRGITYMTQF